MIKVQGDWCRGCNVICEYKNESRLSGDYKASLEHFAEFIQKIETVVSKAIVILEEELIDSNGLQRKRDRSPKKPKTN